MKRLKLFLAVVLMTAACHSELLIGEWVQPIPGMEEQIQGIRIEKGGKASSINMHTLVYESWKKDGNELVLTGKSIGNGMTIEFSDRYIIKTLNNNVLVLQEGEQEQVYKRKTE